MQPPGGFSSGGCYMPARRGSGQAGGYPQAGMRLACGMAEGCRPERHATPPEGLQGRGRVQGMRWNGKAAPLQGAFMRGAVLGRHGAMCLDGTGGARAVKRPPSCRTLAGAGVCAGRRAAGVGKQAFRGCAWGLATCNVLAWGTRALKTGRLLLGVRAGVSLQAWEMCVFQGCAWGLATCKCVGMGAQGH